MMDRLSVHSDKNDVKHLYSELNIKQILNVGYSPEFNCIESCFSHTKRYYGKQRLAALANEKEFDEKKTAIAGLKLITKDLVQACERKSMFLLKRDLNI